MSLQRIPELKKVLVNGVQCLLTEARTTKSQLKSNKKYPYIYDLREGDDGEPWSIEKNVVVNYFGTILAPESFLKNGKRLTNGKRCKDIDACECGCGRPSFLYLE
jgi:hypothetical protein